jgi:restriction system protein
MSEAEPTMWGIHAGSTGDADPLFLKKHFIAIGWPEMGDLDQIPSDRESFKARYVAIYPDKKPRQVSADAGQLYRFVHEIGDHDLVAYSSKADRQVHIGQVIGPYKYDPSHQADYPNLRPVKWLIAMPRTSFTQGALHELGSAMSLFTIKNYADEFRAALEGTAAPQPIEKDETIALVAGEIEQTTRDFILKQLARELKGHPFAYFVAHLLGAMGYRTRISPEGPDGGVDIIAHKDELGLEPPIIKVQVKSGEGNVGIETVSALYGKLVAGEYGLVVTLSKFTPPALNFARGKSNLRLINDDEVVNLILTHYEQLDPSYKGVIPLKRVYVPESLEEGQE